MSDIEHITESSHRLLDFAEFFLRLGDLQVPQVLVAIADRDPEFTYYIDTVKEHPQTLLDMFRLYGRWAIDRFANDHAADWIDVMDSALQSERYRILRMQWEQTSLLWEEWERLVGRSE
jgi:hypothetical protein